MVCGQDPPGENESHPSPPPTPRLLSPDEARVALRRTQSHIQIAHLILDDTNLAATTGVGPQLSELIRELEQLALDVVLTARRREYRWYRLPYDSEAEIDAILNAAEAFAVNNGPNTVQNAGSDATTNN